MRGLFTRGAVALCAIALLSSAARAQARPAVRQAPLDRWLGQLKRPFIIAIAGDSGSGKSTFARNPTATLGAGRVKVICVDDYHCLDRQGRKERGVTALNPVATDLDRLARDLGELRRGRPIQKPVYDHSNGTLAPAERFDPAPIILVEGLHPFATAALREQADLTVYFDPSPRVKETWKIKRDVSERGHDLAAVRREIRARRPDYRRFIEPQRGEADMVVRFDWSRLAPGNEGLKVKVRERNLPLRATRARFNKSGASFVLRGERRADGTGVVTLDGPVPRSSLARLERALARITGMQPEVERRSETLDGARVLLASRVLRQIARTAARTDGATLKRAAAGAE